MRRVVLLLNPPAPPDAASVKVYAKLYAGVSVARDGGTDSPLPSQTLAYLAAILEQSRMAVTALDAAWQGLNREQAWRQVQAARPSRLFVQVADAGMSFLWWLRPRFEGEIVCFGSAAGAHPPRLFAAGADVVLVGEPEATVLDWVAGDGSWAGVDGAITRADFGRGAVAAPRYVADLDALPFPNWSALGLTGGQFTAESSRGCIHACTYCPQAFGPGRSFRPRSVTGLVAEIDWLREECGMKRLIFRDPVFALERARVRALCKQILERRWQFEWSCESRPEHFDHELLALMGEAGCRKITVGVATLDADLLVGLRRVGDATEAELYCQRVEEVITAARAGGIAAEVVALAGLPGQSAASYRSTLDRLQSLAPTRVSLAPYVPVLNTSLGASRAA